MNYERFFVCLKERVADDFGDSFDSSLLDELSLSLSHRRYSPTTAGDHYRSRAAKVPAYYNPNSHTIHLNVGILESAERDLIENIYYHELLHAASHHARITTDTEKILKSGLKIQVWDTHDRQKTLHRSLNEGLTQYFANLNTQGGSAYRNEVTVIGKLIQRIGMSELKDAYFGSGIDRLERKVRVTMGESVFERLSLLVDTKHYEAAVTLLSH